MTGVQTCALPISSRRLHRHFRPYFSFRSPIWSYGQLHGLWVVSFSFNIFFYFFNFILNLIFYFFFIFRWLYTLGRYCSYPLLLYFFFICFLSFTNLSLFFLQIFVFDLVVAQTAKGSFSFYFFVLIF